MALHFLEYTAADVMTPHPVTIGRGTPLAEVERIFAEHDFNSLPVVDEIGGLVGVLTKLDVLKAFAFTPRSVIPPYADTMRRPAGSFMTVGPMTVSPDTPLTRVLQKMVRSRCKSFPVVVDGRAVGIVAREDVLRALREAVTGEEAHALHA